MAATDLERERLPVLRATDGASCRQRKVQIHQLTGFEDAFKHIFSPSCRSWQSAPRQRERRKRPKSRPPSLKILSGRTKNVGFHVFHQQSAKKEQFYQKLKTGGHIRELYDLPVWP